MDWDNVGDVRTRLLQLLISPLSALLLACQQGVAWPAVKQRIRDEFPGVEQVSTAELDAWLASGDAPPLLLDVREEAEYRVSHLRGAVRVDPLGGDRVEGEPAAELALPPGIGKDDPIVTYCSVGYRSSRVAERLRAQGYTRVKNLEGSIFEWANRGLPVVRDGEEVRQVHPYSRRWQRLLDAELRAYSVD